MTWITYSCFLMCRIAMENKLFAGVWYGSMLPDMGLLLMALAQSWMSLPMYKIQHIDSLVSLDILGTALSTPGGETGSQNCISMPTLDLPARAAVLNFVQFKEYWRWCHCLLKGKHSNQVVSTGVVSLLLFTYGAPFASKLVQHRIFTYFPGYKKHIITFINLPQYICKYLEKYKPTWTLTNTLAD